MMSITTMEIDLPFLSLEPDRHGNDRLYARRNGKRIRLHTEPDKPGFTTEYDRALTLLGPPPSQRPKVASTVRLWPKGSFGWLAVQYFASKGEGGFLDLDEESRRAKRNMIELCLELPFTDADPDPMGNCPLSHLTAKKMRRMIEAVDGAGARTNRRKHLSALCSWGVEENHLPGNPVRDIKAGRRVKTGGFYTWLIPDVQQFLAYHRAQDTKRSRKAILALSLLLFAGTRRQDMVDLGRQHCRGSSPGELGDWIRYVPKKTIKVRRDVSQKPLLPILRQVITESADILGAMTFLVTEQGKPFSEAGFGNWFRDRCDAAGLEQCTAHGLKKAGATIAAENGATTRQLMAMFDWDTPDMAEVYTRAAEQKRLAGEGMFLISLDRTGNEDCRTQDGVGDVACRTA